MTTEQNMLDALIQHQVYSYRASTAVVNELNLTTEWVSSHQDEAAKLLEKPTGLAFDVLKTSISRCMSERAHVNESISASSASAVRVSSAVQDTRSKESLFSSSNALFAFTSILDSFRILSVI